jgi:hypothetical protein
MRRREKAAERVAPESFADVTGIRLYPIRNGSIKIYVVMAMWELLESLCLIATRLNPLPQPLLVRQPVLAQHGHDFGRRIAIINVDAWVGDVAFTVAVGTIVPLRSVH